MVRRLRRRAMASASCALLGIGASCVEPLAEPQPCAAGQRFEDGACRCDGELVPHRDSGECTPCDGPDEAVAGDECVPCDSSQEKVDGRCVDCPPAGSAVTSCLLYSVNAATSLTMNGCITGGDNLDAYACLTGVEGPAAAVECDRDASTVTGPACYAPRADGGPARCPAEVLRVEGVGTPRCAPLDPSGVVIVPEGTPCECRDADLVARCDGVGVILGQFGTAADSTHHAMSPIAIPIPVGLGTSGRMGVYVRARGFAVPFYVFLSDPGDPEADGWSFFVSKGYDALIGFGVEQDGVPLSTDSVNGIAFSETNPPPRYLVLTLPEIFGGIDQSAIVEIDCVIPFMVE